MIGGKVIEGKALASGFDPSNPSKPLYQYSLADSVQVEMAIQSANFSSEEWRKVSLEERIELLVAIAHQLRLHRDRLIGSMIADTGKIVTEADAEISEAIDFAEYYARNIKEICAFEDLSFEPKGTVLVAPPWNFPCSIPTGGIVAALATGNVVLFKPATEAILVGWELVQILWKAGIPKDVLQFVTCFDEPVGSELIKDPRIHCIILTGATATAKHFMKMRPGVDLIAETGGKNAIIVTSLSDRDLAIKDLVYSAFGHAGQKCSACSLAVLEKEVYDDLHFRQQLKDAAASLKVGASWDLSTKINPLIHIPNQTLLKALTQLEEGEEWLLVPKQDKCNPNLWSPGIKLGVKPGSYTHQTEFFGPVLGIMRAENLDEAIQYVNSTTYGLTSGIQSLDDREQNRWLEQVEAGNYYVNRGITGAIVERQPFGGFKESSFGRGAKAGGPNYLTQLMKIKQKMLPGDREPLPRILSSLDSFIRNTLPSEEYDLWKASSESYSYYWSHYFSKEHDPSKRLGQDNFLQYHPYPGNVLCIQRHDSPVDIFRSISACLIVKGSLQIFGLKDKAITSFLKDARFPGLTVAEEEIERWLPRVKEPYKLRLRYISQPHDSIYQISAMISCFVNAVPILANGRFELLNYLREKSVSIDYHRYGNLGCREDEVRNLEDGINCIC